MLVQWVKFAWSNIVISWKCYPYDVHSINRTQIPPWQDNVAPFDLVVATKSRSVPAVSSDRGVGIGKFAILNAVDIIGDLNTLGFLPKINSCCTSKKLEFWLKIVKIIQFLTLKPIKGTLGFILETMKKIARWRHKSEISKRNVKTMISPLLFRL